MGEAFLDKQSGSKIKIDGLIHDYYVYAGENISAGGFVEFINGVAGQRSEEVTVTKTEDSVDTSIVPAQRTGLHVSAVAISDNKIFIAHRDSSTSYYLNAVVCTITGAEITAGADTTLSTASSSSYALSTLLLSNGNVLVIHRSDKTNYYLNAMVCTVSGTTITKGSDYTIGNTKYNGYYKPSATLLTDGKVFVTFGNDDEIPSTYGAVCTISGTSISTGTKVTLSSSSYSGMSNSTIRLNDGSVFIAHRSSGDYYLRAMVCTVSGTSITIANTTNLSTGDNTGVNLSTTLLPNGKVFLVHGKGYLDARVVTASTSSISSGTALDLTSYSDSVRTIDTMCINSSKVLVVIGYPLINGIVCTISGNTITAGTNTEIISEDYCGMAEFGSIAVKLANGNIFIAHTNITDENNVSYPLEGIVIGVDTTNNLPVQTVTYTVTETQTVTTYETQVRNTLNKPQGVALTDGIGGSATAHGGKVTIKQANVIPSEWEEITRGTEYIANDGTKITASSYSNNPIYYAYKAFDGDDSTMWYSNTNVTTAWLQIEFPFARIIKKIRSRIYVTPTSGSTIDILGSNNGSTWTTLHTFSYQGSFIESALTTTGSFKYYKINFNMSGSGYARIYGFEILE